MTAFAEITKQQVDGARRKFAHALIARLASPADERAATELKAAITAAHSFGTLSQSEAVALIRLHRLVGA